MKDFEYYLEENQEVGYVEEVLHSVCYSDGLPEAHPREVVVFESGALGQVMSLVQDKVEILLLNNTPIRSGDRVARTGKTLDVPVADDMLGKMIDPLGFIYGTTKVAANSAEARPVDINPEPIMKRAMVDEPLETGVTVVDLAVPLGVGQRELVIGDRKSGKTIFINQAMLTQAMEGAICIYAGIAKRTSDITSEKDFLVRNKIDKSTIMVISNSSDPAGLIFLTPYTAMTLAEYFRNKGKNVLVVMDDMTAHAKSYREFSLLAKRFPGRSSYPGDIFYVHARLLERAGKYKDASISCLPIAETVLGDLSGYIQTNLMAMTDGHIFFDSDFANAGRRPAINTFLSVTRVGYQAQTPLLRDLSRELSSFLVQHERMKSFLHFGAEMGENIKRVLDRGDRIIKFFDQANEETIPLNINVALAGGIWSNIWKESGVEEMKAEMRQIIAAYKRDANFQKQIDTLVTGSNKFSELIEKIKERPSIITSAVKSEMK